ncbi:MAG: insulinase family protein [Candidatus Gastranaerophilales bacterium]|nr:insulinase family protein [Candidatus Gastranaerophilales bacterium]
MQHFNKSGINILLEQSKATPRMCASFFFKTSKKEKIYGINSLLARLLLQGTKKYSASELALEFENECIDISSKAKQDYIKLSLVFLNEDFKKAMDLVADLIENSTFENWEKEIFKIKGEIISDLDNPKIKLTDTFIKEIFKNHPYSSTLTNILDDIDKITFNDVKEAHKQMLENAQAVVLVGDYENEDEMLSYLEEKFPFMKSIPSENEIEDLFKNDINEDKTIFVEKNDAMQAQILQGWLVESFTSDKCAKISVLNNILGASGLSSRLFINLRDKQGLAYTVRSQYETLLHSGIFTLYIGTDPKNIQKSLDGFYDELKKLADTPVSDEELKGAKENISGRIKYFTQNNSQIASVEGYDFIMGLGLNYGQVFLKDVFNVTKEDVKSIASMLLSMPKLNVIIAPKEYRI